MSLEQVFDMNEITKGTSYKINPFKEPVLWILNLAEKSGIETDFNYYRHGLAEINQGKPYLIASKNFQRQRVYQTHTEDHIHSLEIALNFVNFDGSLMTEQNSFGSLNKLYASYNPNIKVFNFKKNRLADLSVLMAITEISVNYKLKNSEGIELAALNLKIKMNPNGRYELVNIEYPDSANRVNLMHGTRNMLDTFSFEDKTEQTDFRPQIKAIINILAAGTLSAVSAKEQSQPSDSADPLEYFQSVAARIGMPLHFDTLKSTGITFQTDFSYFCTGDVEKIIRGERHFLKILLSYSGGQAEHDKLEQVPMHEEFLKYLDGHQAWGTEEQYRLPIQFIDFDLSKHKIANFGKFSKNMTITFLYEIINEYKEVEKILEIEVGQTDRDNFFLIRTTYTDEFNDDKNPAMRDASRKFFRADLLEETNKSGDFRPYLEAMVRIFSGVNPRLLKPIHVRPSNIKSDAEPKKHIEKEEKGLEIDPLGFIGKLCRQRSIPLIYSPLTSAHFRDQINSEAGLNFLEASAQIKNGREVRNLSFSLRFNKTTQLHLQNGISLDTGFQSTPMEFYDYLNGKYDQLRPLANFSFDGYRLQDFGEFADYIGLRVRSSVHYERTPYSMMEFDINQSQPGVFELGQVRFADKTRDQFDSFNQHLLDCLARRSRRGFKAIQLKDYSSKDFRPYLLRAMEVFQGIKIKNFHDPNIWSLEDPQQVLAEEDSIVNAMNVFFTPSERSELEQRMQNANLSLGKWASIPRLSVGSTELPVPGIREMNPEDYLMQGGLLLLENLKAMGMITREEAVQKFSNVVIHRLGFQKNVQRARQVVSALKRLNDNAAEEVSA